MTGRYAAGTEVPPDRSRAEIERTLTRYGASSFAYGWDAGRAVLAFTAKGRQVRYVLPMPDPKSREFRFTPTTGRLRSESAAVEAYQQATRQRWRALALLVKAQLEAVEAGILTFETAFMAQTVLPGGQTVSEAVEPRIVEAYASGQLPALLPGPAD